MVLPIGGIDKTSRGVVGPGVSGTSEGVVPSGCVSGGNAVSCSAGFALDAAGLADPEGFR